MLPSISSFLVRSATNSMNLQKVSQLVNPTHFWRQQLWDEMTLSFPRTVCGWCRSTTVSCCSLPEISWRKKVKRELLRIWQWMDQDESILLLLAPQTTKHYFLDKKADYSQQVSEIVFCATPQATLLPGHSEGFLSSQFSSSQSQVQQAKSAWQEQEGTQILWWPNSENSLVQSWDEHKFRKKKRTLSVNVFKIMTVSRIQNKFWKLSCLTGIIFSPVQNSECSSLTFSRQTPVSRDITENKENWSLFKSKLEDKGGTPWWQNFIGSLKWPVACCRVMAASLHGTKNTTVFISFLEKHRTFSVS